jgi:predicted PurR-regulated permease PerM
MAESTTPVYAAIDESVITSDNVYTQVSKTEQGKEAEATIQGPSRISTTNADKQRAGALGFKFFACIFITITIVAVITLICLAVLFAEVSTLKTYTTQSTTSQQMEDDFSSIRLQLQQIKENLSMTKDFVDSENSHVHNVINILSEMFNHTVKKLTDKFQQLNSSVVTKTQLNVSVDQLNQQLDTVTTDLIPQLNSSLNSQQASLLALNSSIRMDLRLHSDSLDELQRLRPGQAQALPVSSCASLNDLPSSFLSGQGFQ